MTADVSILIPAYAAEGFVDQTLLFARGQTYERVPILVSVDKSEDQTLARVQRHAEQDSRIALFDQSDRLGWAGNVNFLLDQVTTPYCYIYFHDDIIAPRYTERMLAALKAHPDAAISHCGVRYFGGTDSVLPARGNDGSLPRRLMKFMLAPDRGAPLRGMMRRDVMGHLRLPNDQTLGLWANETYLMEVAAAGALVCVPEILYMNWASRPGGLLRSWRDIAATDAVRGLRAMIDRAIAILDRATTNEGEREAFHFSCFLWVHRFIRDAEQRAMERIFSTPGELHPAFDASKWPADVSAFGDETVNWAKTRWEAVQPDLAARERA